MELVGPWQWAEGGTEVAQGTPRNEMLDLKRAPPSATRKASLNQPATNVTVNVSVED